LYRVDSLFTYSHLLQLVHKLACPDLRSQADSSCAEGEMSCQLIWKEKT
jgi:hypothetical protein